MLFLISQVLLFIMESEDDDVAIVVWNYIQMLETRPPRELWVHSINKNRNIEGWIAELRKDPSKFYNYFRMSIPTFDHVLELIKNRIQRQNTNLRKCITPEERLAVTLR